MGRCALAIATPTSEVIDHTGAIDLTTMGQFLQAIEEQARTEIVI
jgi:hypothetical protein